jgi:hypothetical protein
MSNRISRLAVACSLLCWIVCSMTANAGAQASSSSSSKPKTSNAEEAAVFERILNRARFENDGTEVSETEAVVRIQSQAGVEEFGQLVFGYSSATEKLEVEYVRVRKPDGQGGGDAGIDGPGFRSRCAEGSSDVQRLPAAAYFRRRAAARGHAGIPHGDACSHAARRRKLLVRVHISQRRGGQ